MEKIQWLYEGREVEAVVEMVQLPSVKMLL
jgi:hypothetical protein